MPPGPQSPTLPAAPLGGPARTPPAHCAPTLPPPVPRGYAAPVGSRGGPAAAARPRQRRLHLPVAHPKLRGDPRDAGAGVATSLQIPAQILKAAAAGAF